MTEDKLTSAQRIRLEALNQSMTMTITTCRDRPKPEDIITNAVLIENFIKNAKE